MLQCNYNTLPMYGRSGDLSRSDIERFLHQLIISEVLVEEAKIGLHDRVYNYVRIGSEAEKVTTTGTNYSVGLILSFRF